MRMVKMCEFLLKQGTICLLYGKKNLPPSWVPPGAWVPWMGPMGPTMGPMGQMMGGVGSMQAQASLPSGDQAGNIAQSFRSEAECLS